MAGIYGAGAADEITEELVRRLAGSDAGRTLLRTVIGAAGEGTEEVVSDMLSPLAEAMVRDESVAALYRQLDPADVLYDYLIGYAMGAFGSGVNIATGQNAEANAELKARDAAEAAYLRRMEEIGYLPAESNKKAAHERAAESDYIHAEHHGKILDGMRQHLSEIEEMESVSTISGNEFQKTANDPRNLRQKVIDFFNQIGNKVFREGFGEIVLNEAGVRDSLGHGYGKLKAATFTSLPSVLKKGKIISFDPDYQGRGYESFLIAAPVTVAGERCYVGAYVIKDVNIQRYKVHEVLTLNKNGAKSFKTETLPYEEHLRDRAPPT